MRKLNIYINSVYAGILEEKENKYIFIYDSNYFGESISFTMPLEKKIFEFEHFPPFFENLIPEGLMLEGISKMKDVNKNDYLSILILTGKNLYGDITVEECK